MKCLFYLTAIFCSPILTHGQISQYQSVLVNSGGYGEGTNITSYSVIGEVVVGEFSNTQFSGSFGFLNVDDSMTTAGIKEPPIKNYKIYPNPTTNNVIIEFEQPTVQNTTLKVTNILGKEIFSKSASFGADLIDIDLTGYEDGLYFITIITNISYFTERIILRK